MVTHIYNLRHGLISESAVTFSTIMDYFGMHLTGRKTPLVHAGNAASFSLSEQEISYDLEEVVGEIHIGGSISKSVLYTAAQLRKEHPGIRFQF